MYLNLLLLVVLALLGSMAYAGWRAAPWVPAKPQDRDAILKALDLRPGKKVYDLGCGHGWLECAAKAQSADIVGFEISIPVYLAAKIRVWLAPGLGKASVRFRDFWHADLGDADTVFCFLIPKAMDRLKKKLARECRPGTRVVSYVFPIDGWSASDTLQLEGGHKILIYGEIGTSDRAKES